MSFDCILFGAGYAGTVITFDGDFVATVLAPIPGTNNKIAFAVTKHRMGALDFAVGIHHGNGVKVTTTMVDAIIQAKGVQPLP